MDGSDNLYDDDDATTCNPSMSESGSKQIAFRIRAQN